MTIPFLFCFRYNITIDYDFFWFQLLTPLKRIKINCFLKLIRKIIIRFKILFIVLSLVLFSQVVIFTNLLNFFYIPLLNLFYLFFKITEIFINYILFLIQFPFKLIYRFSAFFILTIKTFHLILQFFNFINKRFLIYFF